MKRQPGPGKCHLFDLAPETASWSSRPCNQGRYAFTCQNVTSDTANYLRVTSTLNLVNCLLTSVTNVSYYSASYTSNLTSSAGVYQTVGAGAHYLAANSPYRNVGTTSITPSLLADLRKRTTYPPLLLTNKITNYTILAPQVPRDTSAKPDLGFHYDSIDWAVNTLPVTNALLLLTNGVALATYGQNGLWLQDNSQLISEGSPTNLNHFCRYYAVQEQATNWGGGAVASTLTINPYNYGNSPPSVRLWFTESDIPADGGYHLYAYPSGWGFSSLELKHSQFSGGMIYLYEGGVPTYGFTNCLFERLDFQVADPLQFNAYNNLFTGVSGSIYQSLNV